MFVRRLSGSRDRSPFSPTRSGVLGVMFGALVACAADPAFAAGEAEGDAGEGHGLHGLAAKPHLVSGGSVLVEVDVPRDDTSARVDLNGQDISGVFHRDAQTGALTALVDGLRIGENTLSLFDHGFAADSLALTNYPITGPITSGPHVTPFICQTQEFVLPDGSKLGAPLDADCSAPTVIRYLYLPTGATALVPLPST